MEICLRDAPQSTKVAHKDTVKQRFPICPTIYNFDINNLVLSASMFRMTFVELRSQEQNMIDFNGIKFV